VPQWYINLEDKAEEHGPVTHLAIPEQQAQEWLAGLLQKSRANKPIRWGKPQNGIDNKADQAPGEPLPYEE
jgi:hypothetical protein